MPMTFRLLTAHDVAGLLVGQDLVGLMEGALAAYSSGEVVQPVRTSVLVGPERAVLGLMPAHMPSRAALGSKLVTVFNRNHARGLPSPVTSCRASRRGGSPPTTFEASSGRR
jgi:ornithine cyclodeaminase